MKGRPVWPAAATWHVERRGRLCVLVPDGPVPPLAGAEIRDALDQGRDPERRWSDSMARHAGRL